MVRGFLVWPGVALAILSPALLGASRPFAKFRIHRHQPLVHAPHYPDLHHRHGHKHAR